MPDKPPRQALRWALRLAVVVALWLLGTYIPAWQAHRHASVLLACDKTFVPGPTTEAQARECLKPLASFAQPRDQDDATGHFQTVTYSFSNLSPLARITQEMPASWDEYLTLPWTLFKTEIRFQNGIVTKVFIQQMQEDYRGAARPNAASVTLLPTPTAPNLLKDFNGYATASSNIGGFNASGHWTGTICCHTRTIQLDGRASVAQHNAALDFQLDCLIARHRCKDDHDLLP